uniref:Uncharacterized protein n=1 Tax=Oryza brachyantha TaxID=4533 RepID=J3MSM4_ORYBR
MDLVGSVLGLIYTGLRSKQIEEHLTGCASTSDQSATHTEVMPPNNLLGNACLKKKEVRVRSSKRKRNWLDKKRNIGQQQQSKKSKSLKKQKTKENALQVGAAQVVEDSFAIDKEPGEYMHLNSFTQLLTGPINVDLLVDDAFLVMRSCSGE